MRPGNPVMPAHSLCESSRRTNRRSEGGKDGVGTHAPVWKRRVIGIKEVEMSAHNDQWPSRRAFTRMATALTVSAVLPFYEKSLARSGQSTRFAAAKAEIESRIAASGAEVVGVAAYDLGSKQTLLLNERTSLHAASTMKLPVMMELFRLADAKQLSLRAPIEVRNKFFSIVDGGEYQLRRSDDGDEELYNRIGRKMPVIELINHMITMSSNLATNILIETAKPDSIMALMQRLGATDIRVLRGVEDQKAFDAGRNNTTTAYDLMVLLRALAENKFLNKKACEQMVAILAAQHFNEGIPAGLPTGVKVAHKTGDINRHNHDAAIVYPVGPAGRSPYVVVILTKGIAEHRRSSKLIAEISRIVYQAIVQ
jgi:beta-lactamase class A